MSDATDRRPAPSRLVRTPRRHGSIAPNLADIRGVLGIGTAAMLTAGLLAAASLVALPGCNIVAPIALMVTPDPVVKPLHELPDRPTVVFVDDRANKMNPISLRRTLADQTTQLLINAEVISPENAIRARDALAIAAGKDRSGELLSIERIGTEVGAEQIVYIRVDDFRLSIDGVEPQPVGQVGVKVLDLVAKSRPFPPPADGAEASDLHMVGSSLRTQSLERYNSRAAVVGLQQALATEMGTDVAQLFYEHSPKTLLGSNLEKPQG